MSIFQEMFISTQGIGILANTPYAIIDQASGLPAVLPAGSCPYGAAIFNDAGSTTLPSGVNIRLGTLADQDLFIAASDGFSTDYINNNQMAYKSKTVAIGMATDTGVYLTVDADYDDSGANQISGYIYYVSTM